MFICQDRDTGDSRRVWLGKRIDHVDHVNLVNPDGALQKAVRRQDSALITLAQTAHSPMKSLMGSPVREPQLADVSKADCQNAKTMNATVLVFMV